ncbi:aminotransferase class III-fold pyridoxal phosphate-dependent enzyme [Gloeomargarita lithophora]|nr:aminotransferase class III-fold pyridoxal phosphate-dependent enzyme [Gloeomargarita lithophora]
MTTLAIIQARMKSTRLPNKVMLPVLGKPLIEFLLYRLSKSKRIEGIVVATGERSGNLPIIDAVQKLGYTCEIGSEYDVLDRYYKVAQKYQAETVIRITADCPLLDPRIVDQVIELFENSSVDYCATSPGFGDGLDVEIFSFKALEQAWYEGLSGLEREHVSLYIRDSGLFELKFLECPIDISHCRWTVDELEDYQVVKKVFEYFSPRLDFSWQEIWQLQQEKPEIFTINQHIARNEGVILGTGQKLWKRAKKVIPGGSMLLSKRSEMFLPKYWPSYFSKAKGCSVWDLDNNEYIDMSIMGIGTNILGYGHPEVDAAVQEVIVKGNMSTFNAPEEVYLAERLIELHPWANMVRFARTGGEVCTIAIRIARLASGKDKVAFCGYHGWHDWYLSANLQSQDNLNKHLLSGLEPQGVPKGLAGTAIPFTYNNFIELEQIISEHEIGVVIMEVTRNNDPIENFLEKVRDLCTQKGIVLIFDECTSGFRETFGGIHKKYDIEPDMVTFGKALGNGYAITAVIGKRSVMEAVQDTFISSTFWTERIGSVAGLKTLEVMEQLKSWELITETGLKIRQGWQSLADQYGLTLKHWGIPALTGFSFASDNHLAYKTLITQEMLKKGFLAGNSIYVCIDHQDSLLEQYFTALDEVFAKIYQCEQGLNVYSLLEQPICHAGFQRLN